MSSEPETTTGRTEEPPGSANTFENRFHSVSITHHPSLRPFQITTGHVHLQAPCHSFNWSWSVDLDSYDVITGLSKIAHALPQLLALMMSGKGISPCENSRKVISKLRRKAVIVPPPAFPGSETALYKFGNSFVFRGRTASIKRILTLLHSKLGELINFYHSSNVLPYDQLMARIHPILHLCDNVILICHCYLEFVHPLWIQAEQNPMDFNFGCFYRSTQKLKHLLTTDQFLGSRSYYSTLYAPNNLNRNWKFWTQKLETFCFYQFCRDYFLCFSFGNFIGRFLLSCCYLLKSYKFK